MSKKSWVRASIYGIGIASLWGLGPAHAQQFPDPQVLTYGTRSASGMVHSDVGAKNAPHLVWEKHIPQDIFFRLLQQEFSTPVVMGDRLLVPSVRQSGILVYDRHSGRHLDTWALGRNIESDIQVIDDESLIVADSKGTIYRLDSQGQMVWETPLDEGIRSNLNVVDGIAYYHTLNGQIGGLNIETGERKWSYTRTPTGEISILGGSTPQVNGSRAYAGFTDGYVGEISTRSGALQWEIPLSNPDDQWMDVDVVKWVDDGCLFASAYEGPSTCLDPNSGRLIWSHDAAALHEPLVVGNLLIINSLDGLVTALNRDSGEEIWTYQAPKSTAATAKPQSLTPIRLWKGQLLFASSRGVLHALDTTSGASLWTYRPWVYSYGFNHAPVLEGESIYLISNGGYIYHLVTDDYDAPALSTHREDWVFEGMGADARIAFRPDDGEEAINPEGETDGDEVSGDDGAGVGDESEAEGPEAKADVETWDRVLRW